MPLKPTPGKKLNLSIRPETKRRAIEYYEETGNHISPLVDRLLSKHFDEYDKEKELLNIKKQREEEEYAERKERAETGKAIPKKTRNTQFPGYEEL